MIDQNQMHGLWVRGPLSPLAELTVKSFVRHHGEFTLWTYDSDLVAPTGTSIKDASEIIPESSVFFYNAGDANGSFGGFSDIFRAKLLLEYGGWWTDMDITLMKPIPVQLRESAIVLRQHWRNPIVGNLMKFPSGSPAMQTTYDVTRRLVNESNTDWDKPIRLLSRTIKRYKLLKYRQRIGHLDEFIDVLPFVRLPIRIPGSWWAMHWCNEMWRRGHPGLQINTNSHLVQLLNEYGVKHPRVGNG